MNPLEFLRKINMEKKERMREELRERLLRRVRYKCPGCKG